VKTNKQTNKQTISIVLVLIQQPHGVDFFTNFQDLQILQYFYYFITGHHIVEEAESKYWWLHRGVKSSAPTINPVMIPYRFTGGNFAAKMMHGSGQYKMWMMNEFEMMNVLHHPRYKKAWMILESVFSCSSSTFCAYTKLQLNVYTG
jgi:hypothetical protein